MITRKKKICKSCDNPRYIWAKGMCRTCATKAKPPKPICKRTDKKKAVIKDSNKYYRMAIARNIVKNKGVCRCDECDVVIKNPKGRNVAHIISGGANPALYLDPDNQNVLCIDCVIREESGTNRKEMKLYEQRENTRTLLTNKYYTKSHD